MLFNGVTHKVTTATFRYFHINTAVFHNAIICFWNEAICLFVFLLFFYQLNQNDWHYSKNHALYQSNPNLTLTLGGSLDLQPSGWPTPLQHSLALQKYVKKKLHIYVILQVPWQPLLTQYPVSERVGLRRVAFGPPPNRQSMKITHSAVACGFFWKLSKFPLPDLGAAHRLRLSGGMKCSPFLPLPSTPHPHVATHSVL